MHQTLLDRMSQERLEEESEARRRQPGQKRRENPGKSEGKEVQRGNERAVGSTRTPRHREPPREEVRVPGPKNRSPGKRAGDGRKQADSCPRRRRLLVLRRVGGESGWVPRATAPAGLKAAPSPPSPPPGFRAHGRFLHSRRGRFLFSRRLLSRQCRRGRTHLP